MEENEDKTTKKRTPRKRDPETGKPLRKDGTIIQNTGRPLVPIDEDEVYRLAQIGCTYDEIALVLNVERSTLIRRCTPIIKRGHAEIKMSLRRAQLHKALKEQDNTMLIWLGKQMLGQQQNPETAIQINVGDQTVETKISKASDDDLLDALEGDYSED